MPVRFHEFDITTLSHTGSVGFIAPTRSGKTTLMLYWLWIIYQYGYTDDLNFTPAKKGVKVDLVVVMSPTIDMQAGGDSDFARCVPKGFIFAGYSESIIQQILDYQLKRKKEGTVHRVILVLDDLSHKQEIFKSKFFLSLHSLGRHYNMQLWTVYHDARQIPSQVRTNYGAIVAFKDNSERNQDLMYKNYFGGFGTFGNFKRLFSMNTVNRQAMIQIKHGVTSNKLTNYTFITRAYPKRMPPKWKMGRPVYWYWSRKYPYGCENSVMPDSKRKKIKTIKAKKAEQEEEGFIPVKYGQPIVDTNDELDQYNSAVEKELDELEAVEQSLLSSAEPPRQFAQHRATHHSPHRPPPRPPTVRKKFAVTQKKKRALPPPPSFHAPPQPRPSHPPHRPSRPPHPATQSASAIVREALNQSSHFSQQSHHQSKRLQRPSRPVKLTMLYD